MAYTTITPYADVTYTTAYFGDRLNSAPWTNASSVDQLKALKQATRAIDNLNFAGEKHDDTADVNGTPNQVRQFPRGDDTLVPDPILQACCELALALLDGVDPNLEIENLQNSHNGMEGARVVRDTTYVQEHVRAGIPSIQAWMLLLPFLRDTQHPRIRLERGN